MAIYGQGLQMNLPNHFTLCCSVLVKLWVSHIHLPILGEKSSPSSAVQGTLQWFLKRGGCLAQMYPLGNREMTAEELQADRRAIAIMRDSLDLDTIAGLSGRRFLSLLFALV